MDSEAYIHWMEQPESDPQVTDQPIPQNTLASEIQRWPLSDAPAVIGRKPPAQIVIPMPHLSRRHAVVEPHEWGYAIRDLGSQNGTFVNGVEVGETPVELTSNDQIVLGGEVVLLFTDPEETPKANRVGRLIGIWIDPNTRAVWVDAKPVSPVLSPAQLALLQLLYAADGTIINREQIIAAVWPDEEPSGVSEDAVDGLIKRLRRRLRDTEPNREYVQVVRGHGLRLVLDE